MLDAIHPDLPIAWATILCGVVFGLTLALSDWKSKLTIGSILTAGSGAIAWVTAEKVAALKAFLEGTPLIMLLIYALDFALLTFLIALLGGSMMVFAVNYIPAKRKDDPEAFVRAARRATAIFGSGLYRYVTAPPELEAANRIRDLERHKDVLELIQKTLVREVGGSARGVQHFKDSVNSIGRLLLQFSFGDSADLQHYRMAFFERRDERLEYMVAINNHDWTAHSMNGFNVADCLMGAAILRDKPMVYPRDKKRRVPYVKRRDARYKSFIAIPVPCGLGHGANVGAMTVDYTGKDATFTGLRIDELFALAQFIHSFYLLNVKENRNGKEANPESN